MPEFLQLLPPDQALDRLFAHLIDRTDLELVDSAATINRITREPIIAPAPLPGFTRSTVDGFAVRAADTYGASDSLPAYLRLVREVPMGAPADFSIQIGECALIHTGGMLPQDADAVVMVEQTQDAGNNQVEILRAAAPGENVLNLGEDVRQGELVIPAGFRLRPAEIGGLMALGITRIQVARQPKVGLISSGDEIIPPEQALSPGQVRDVNSYSLSALINASGGSAVHYGIAPDRLEALRSISQAALENSDMLVITAGSSASARDLTAQVINSLGQPGVLVHGVNVRPGKPTILAVCAGKPVIGLPGNPVSALVIALRFVLPVIDRLQGLDQPPLRPMIQARLGLNLASQAGREDWVAVRLVPSSQGYLAEPVFGKSNLIFTLARADGMICIPPDATGLSAGEMVEVFLL